MNEEFVQEWNERYAQYGNPGEWGKIPSGEMLRDEWSKQERSAAWLAMFNPGGWAHELSPYNKFVQKWRFGVENPR